MTAGTVNVYIPIRADNGERSTGIVPKGSRKRATFTRSVDVRNFFDPLADRNLPNAIRTAPKAKPFDPRVAPKGWWLSPVEPVAEPVATPATVIRSTRPGLSCPRCSRSNFRTPVGLAWHVERCASADRRSA